MFTLKIMRSLSTMRQAIHKEIIKAKAFQVEKNSKIEIRGKFPNSRANKSIASVPTKYKNERTCEINYLK